MTRRKLPADYRAAYRLLMGCYLPMLRMHEVSALRSMATRAAFSALAHSQLSVIASGVMSRPSREERHDGW